MLQLFLIYLTTIPIIAWINLKIFSSGSIKTYIISSIFLYLLFLTVYSILYWIDKSGNKRNDRRSHEISSVIFNSIVFLSTYFIIYSFYTNRWILEPHGMDDAIVIWNQKAKVIALDFLSSVEVEFNRDTWKLQSYPLGLPLTIAHFTILVQKWTLEVPYFYSLFLTFLLFNYLNSIIQKIPSKLEKSIVFIVSISFVFKINYVMIQSDLCADYPLSIGIFIFSYQIFQKINYQNIFLNSLVLSWIFSLKDEGGVFSIIGFLLSIFIYFRRTSNPRLYLFFIILYFILILPTIHHKLTISEISYAFSPGNKSLIEKIFNLDSFFLIGSYFLKYHLFNIYGLSLLITVLIIFSRFKTRLFYLCLLYWSMVLIYNLTYFLTNLRLVEHLDTSYDRVNYHFWMLLYILLIYTIKIHRKNLFFPFKKLTRF